MMNSQRQIVSKLTFYGVNSFNETEKSLQQKIIQMYDLLEVKTTQNLLLRKQNDDIKLQIKTIEGIFKCVSLEKEHYLEQKQFQSLKPKADVQLSDQQEKSQKSHKNLATFFSHSKSNYEQNDKRTVISNQYLEDSQTSQQKSVDTEFKTPKYSPKKIPNDRQTKNEFDKCQTFRIAKYKQTKESLSDKVELLMKQNEMIMKRMNQIQINFIQIAQCQNQITQFNKQRDDRSTNISGNSTSINRMRTRKESPEMDKGLKYHNRAHFSTSNLRSCFTSIE